MKSIGIMRNGISFILVLALLLPGKDTVNVLLNDNVCLQFRMSSTIDRTEYYSCNGQPQ